MLPLLAVATLAQWHTVTVYDVLPEDCRFDVGNNDVGYRKIFPDALVIFLVGRDARR